MPSLGVSTRDVFEVFPKTWQTVLLGPSHGVREGSSGSLLLSLVTRRHGSQVRWDVRLRTLRGLRWEGPSKTNATAPRINLEDMLVDTPGEGT